MKQIQALLALALLLLAGLNCGTEDPVEATGDPLVVETVPPPEPEATENLVEETGDPVVIEATPLPEPEHEEVEVLDPGQGLSLGSRAPDFELSDGNGKPHKLTDYIGDKNVVLVFFRGVW